MLDVKLNIDKIVGSVNVAEDIDEKNLSSIGEYVCDGYEIDLESRVDWEDKIDDWLKLALQSQEEKTFPWPNAANVKYPLLTTAALQFSSRAYPALIPGTNVVRGRVIGFDHDGSKLERSIRIGKHMSYQILEEMEEWEEQMDRLLFALPILGCMFKKSYFDSVKGHNVSEVVYPKELVVNYWATSLEDAERITHVLHLTENNLYERVKEGVYLDVDLNKDNSYADKTFNPSISYEVTGINEQAKEDDTTPYVILEQHCLLDLDGDGYKEPYIVTVDYNTRQVLRVVPRFDTDSIIYTENGELWSIQPDQYFTKFSFVPSPDGGFYDIGFGVLLGPINETINTVINQLLDAGTQSNLQSGFIARGIRIKGGNKSFVPGEWKFVNSTGDDLKKGIVPLPVREPSAVLFNLLNLMINTGEKLSSVTDMLTGEIPGQNTKATVAMAAIEEGMKVFSSIYKRVHRSLGKEYKKLYKLNEKYLPIETYFTVLDVGEEVAARIGQGDYVSGDVDIKPASDPNVATEKQRLAKVQALFEAMQLGTINPTEVTRRFLEATEQPNIEALMQMPPPQPSPEAEFEMMKFKDESERDWERLKLESEKIRADGILKIAQAEGAELGQQLDLYNTKLNAYVAKRKLDKETTEESNGNNESAVSGMEE